MLKSPRMTQTLFPINFFCCKTPNHFIPDESNRYQYCRNCHWFFKADLFIKDEFSYRWICEEIKKKRGE